MADMEEKVGGMLQIIDDEGDSFAARAEMYYKKRPELVSIVEESYRAYRALAERYDHLSKDLQSANRTIASVFPEQVPYAMDEEDEENGSHTSTSSTSHSPEGVPRPGIPKAPFLKKDFRSHSILTTRQRQPRRASTSSKAVPFTSSGLSKEEALEEIDSLQKDILELQTEMEFVKSSYEHGYQKFCEIENQISEKQKRVCSLQDEFGIEAVIDDDEARTLMASRALKSCQETLAKLRKKHEQSTEEARAESRRIKQVNNKFEALRNMFDPTQSNEQGMSTEEIDDMVFEIDSVEKERQDLELLQKEIEQQLEMNSALFTISQLAEKIDDLVQRVINLETAVFSENALVQRLRSDADKLQAYVKSLEEDKEALMAGSENMNKRMTDMEEELSKVKDLVKTLVEQNNTFKTHFTEASCNINHLSVKLQSVKMDEEVEHAELSHESDGKADIMSTGIEMEGKEKGVSVEGESCNASEYDSKYDADSKKGLESSEEDKFDKKYFSETASSAPDTDMEDLGTDEEEEHPNWRQLYLSGLEDREKILLDEYSHVLHNYKDVRKKLNDVEKKNRDGFFELALQIGELKKALASRDGEIQALRQQRNFTDENKDMSPGGQEGPRLSASLESTLTESMLTSPMSSVQNEMQLKHASQSHSASSVEDRIRTEIDNILEENLEFWLRFSTSFHQISKYQTSIQDLKAEITKMREKMRQEGSGSARHKQYLTSSDARPIYSHLREIKTELTLWLENNAVLKDEVQGRYSSLCNIQEEIARVTNVSGPAGETELSGYQAAKFQGEVLNMKQENNKVADELKSGFERVRQLTVDVEKVLASLEKQLAPVSGQKTENSGSNSKSRPRIPLRSFLFGIKLKNKRLMKGPSMFACGHPMLQKQLSYIAEPPEQPSQ
ncbi:KIP1-like protein [Corchorus capsularis]|uniref:KIP1-like protein n=1 Tax=Corchorus capsularis TaxID=210143 RepID=A0A1R3FY47_COCAP|nr:KIP1-like protein [Corchorus capsularis]